MTHTRVRLTIAAITGIVTLLIGCDMPWTSKKGLAGAASDSRIRVQVKLGLAERRNLSQEQKIMGVLEAYREADVAPMIPGRVKRLSVKIGDVVQAGQIVAEMDDASLASMDAGLQPLKAQYNRAQSLQAANAMSKAQVEAIEAQYVAQKRQFEQLQENTSLKAPFAGVVTSRACEEGEVFSPPMAARPGESRGLVRITQLDPLKLDLDLDDQTVQHVLKGMTVRLTSDAAPDSIPIVGKVEWVNPQANASSNTFAVRIVVPNAKRMLRPGYFSVAHILLSEKKNVLSVPRSAIVDEKVFVVRDSMAVSVKPVLGETTEEYAEVLSGLDENAQVVVAGNKALPDSARVSVVK
jgi:RND family efflux transporter MFP subunit